MSHQAIRRLLQEDRSQTSPYAVQLAAGFASLRFIEPLEVEFRSYYEEKNLPRGRAALLVGIVLFAAFAGVNYWMMPQGLGAVAAVIQLGFICPLLLSFWFVSFNRSITSRYQRHSVFALLLVAGLGLNAVIFTAHLEQYPYRYEGLILVTMYAYFLAGLILNWAMAASAIIFAGYMIAELLANFPGEQLAYNFFYLLSANIIGVFGGYGMEYLERRNFLQRRVLQSMAERDGLTGILNRRAFDSGFDRLWRQARRDKTPIVLALLDVDCFKSFNDVYGHLAGDDALRSVAGALVNEPHRPLDLMARYGGEEFVAIWFDAQPDLLPGKAESLRRAVETLNIPHRGSTIATVVTISVGAVAVTDPASTDSAQLLEWVDQALYEAKQRGRNRCVCYRVDAGRLKPVANDASTEAAGDAGPPGLDPLPGASH